MKNNFITEEVNKIALSADDDKIQSIDSLETNAYGTSKDMGKKKLNLTV